MNLLKEELNKSNNESDYILFHLKNNKLYFEKTAQKKSRKIINNSKNNFTNNSSIKEKNMEKSRDIQEIIKIPFTNLILREKINSSKYDNYFNEDQSKIYLNKEKFKPEIETNNFLLINKCETINQLQNKDNKANNQTSYKQVNRNFIIKSNANTLSDKNILKTKIEKISTGQQTLLQNDLIKNYNHKNKNNKYNIMNFPIKNKLRKMNSNDKGNIHIKINKNMNNFISINQKNFNSINYINNNENSQYSNEIFESFSTNNNYHSANNSKNRINYTKNINRNQNNEINFNNFQNDKRKNFISVREFFRQMAYSKEKKNKKQKLSLKKKKIMDYLKKSNKSKKDNYQAFTSNLVSLEQYTLEKRNKKRELINKIKLNKKNDCNGKKIKREKSCLFYGFNLKINDFRNSKSELKDNIFNNMLSSLSSDKNNEEKFYSKLNKRSHINILTMLELSNNKEHQIKI